MMNSAIAHIDCNNFYASCERVFAPELREKPIIVLSNNDGCVIARSNEAKQMGVTMGAPLFKVQPLLDGQDVEIFSSNYELYGDMSSRVMSLLHKFSPEVEEYSIDEAFLSLEPRKNSLETLAHSIQEKIYQWTNIPVSIGVGETKVLAKVANKLAKKSDKAQGILNLYHSPHLKTALERTDVADIWGIGRRSAEKLIANSIENAWQLREAPHYHIRKLLTVAGARIALELRGVKCLPFEILQTKKHSITCSRSFGQTVTDFHDVKEAVLHFLLRAMDKLRRHHLSAKYVNVFLSTDRFRPEPYDYSASKTFKSIYPTDNAFELQERALLTLAEIFREGIKYRKAGITLSGLVLNNKLTGRLFDTDEYQKQINLQNAINEINRKFGRDTVRFGGLERGNWRMRRRFKSSAYTTKIDEILTVS